MAWNPEPKTVLDCLVYVGWMTLPQTTICTTWPSHYRRNSTVYTKTSRFMSGSSIRLNSSDFSFIHRVLGMLKLVKLLKVTSSICLFAVFSIMWWWKSGQKSNVPESWRKSYQRLQLKKQTASLSTLQQYALPNIIWIFRTSEKLSWYLYSWTMLLCNTSELLSVFTLPQDVLQ